MCKVQKSVCKRQDLSFSVLAVKIDFLTLPEFDLTSKNAETSSQIQSRKVVSLGSTICTIIFAQLSCLLMMPLEIGFLLVLGP